MEVYQKNIVKSRRRAWYGDEEIVYEFPKNWQVEIFTPKNQTPLNKLQINQKIMNSIGCESLPSYLKPGMKICIISDDISRPTRTDLIIPILLEIIKTNGISLKDICILIATGAHQQLNNKEKLLKFSRNVTQSIKIIDHNPRKDLVHLGTTSLGTPVYVNKYVAESDFIIGIGGIYPHSSAGFCGGAKLILGVSGIKTIRYFHFMRNKAWRGGPIDNEFRKDLLEVARLARMNFIINNLLSEDREIVDIFAGDVKKAFIKGVNEVKKIYPVPDPKEFSFDLVIADTYPFDYNYIMSRKGWWPVLKCRKESHRLVISAIPSGVGFHDLYPILVCPQHLINRFFQLQTFSVKEIVRIVSSRLKLATSKINNKTNYRYPITLIHNLDNNQILRNSNVIFSNKFEEYVKSIQQSIGKKSLKVGFYKASSLTF